LLHISSYAENHFSKQWFCIAANQSKGPKLDKLFIHCLKSDNSLVNFQLKDIAKKHFIGPTADFTPELTSR
jgi:hypothetical protein